MAFNDLPSELGLGGGAGLHDHEVRQLRDALIELQSVSTAVVAGGSASSDLTLTGIKVGDTITGAVFHDGAGAVADDLANVTITDDDTIQSTTNTTGGVLVVTWASKPTYG